MYLIFLGPPNSPPTFLLRLNISIAMAIKASEQNSVTEKAILWNNKTKNTKCSILTNLKTDFDQTYVPGSTAQTVPLASCTMAASDHATPIPRKTLTALLPVTLPTLASAYLSWMAATLLAKVSVEGKGGNKWRYQFCNLKSS